MKTTRTLIATALATFLAFSFAPPAHAAAGDLDPLNANVADDNGAYIYATAVQPDGKIIIAGHFQRILGVPRRDIARLNADGTLDMGFAPNPVGDVHCVVVQADGKVLLGGGFGGFQPDGSAFIERPLIARLNADGTLDMNFDPRPNGAVFSMAVQADGKVLLCGSFTTLQPNGAPNATSRQRIARVHESGTLDTGFDPKANIGGLVYGMAVQTDGKVLLGGSFTALQPNGAATAIPRQRIARVNEDGTLDTGFDPKANDIVYNVVVQADGKVLLGGVFTTLQPNGAGTATGRLRIARVNGDGTLDADFDPRADFTVNAMALQVDGRVLLGGGFMTLRPNGGNIIPRSRIARVNGDGTVDPHFDPSADNDVYGLAVQADGKVLLGGFFTTLQPNGAGAATARNYFARLENDPATQTLSAPDASQVLWTRGGAGPELTRVTFEVSTNGGASWIPLGAGTRIGTTASWQRTALSLPATGHLRARGVTTGPSRFSIGSSGLIEQVASFAPLSNLQAWKLANLGDPNAPDTGDSDSDGLVNFLEYALGTSPTAANPAPGARILTEAGGTHFGIDFDFRGPPSDATIEVQVAGDLSGPWTTVGTSVNGAPMTGSGVIPSGAANHAQVRDIVPMSAQTQRFLRLRVSH